MAKKKISIARRRWLLERRVEELVDAVEGGRNHLEKNLVGAERALEALKKKCKHSKVVFDERFPSTCPDCGFKNRPV